MVAVVIQAASAVVEELRALVHVPLEKYFHYLPRMPNGEKPADLVKAGFPQASDLLDGVLLILALTALRVVVTPLCLEGLGRVVMKHRYYQTPANPTLDAMLQCVWLPCVCIPAYSVPPCPAKRLFPPP